MDFEKTDLEQIEGKAMFFEPAKGDHGFSHSPVNSLIIPRPIGWITSLDKDGNVNLAPYSFFNLVSYRPLTVMFSVGYGTAEDDRSKDTLRNVQETGEFVHNVTTWDTREAMNATSETLGKGIDELARAGLTPLQSKLVKPPRVAEAPAHFECKHVGSYVVPHTKPEDIYTVVFGEVVGVHIEDQLITEDGRIDVAKLKPLGRLGYLDYSTITGEKIFTMERPET